jgi:hypothetical protein
MNIARGLVVDVDALLSGAKPMKQYIEQSEYRDSMTLWRAATNPGQLYVIPYDHVQSDPATVVSLTCEIAGVSNPGDLREAGRQVHKGKEFDFPKTLRVRLMEKLEPQYEFLSHEFPNLVTKWRAKHAAAMLA